MVTAINSASDSDAPLELSPGSSVSSSVAIRPDPKHDHSYDRLSLAPLPRIGLATLISSFSGFFLGFAYGSRTAGLRFRAENAHRLPTTQQNWYLYHKSKNYSVIRAGVREGMRMGSKLGVWVSLFFVIENGIDRFRVGEVGSWLESGVESRPSVERTADEESKKDCFSTAFAGLSVAGAYSAWNRIPLATTGSLIRMGLLFGVGYGLVQDAGALLKGNKVYWLERLKDMPHGKDEAI